MKLNILGSSGGEAFPALFCGCDHCVEARKLGGKNIRTLSQSLINDDLLIDLPADTHMHFAMNNMNLGDIENLLITHTHADHYCPNLFELRGSVFAHNLKYKKMNVYGNADVKTKFEGYYEVFPIAKEIRDNIEIHELEPLKKVHIGKYDVTPLHAHHAMGQQVSLNYIIEDRKSSLLYLIDSGLPYPETFERIAAVKKPYDCVVMDGTMGYIEPEFGYEGHMCFKENIALKEKLLSCGAADEHTKFIVTHITHNHTTSHEEAVKYFKPHGIEVAYDGYKTEF